MVVNHVISSIDISTGGPARSVTSLISAILSNSNIKIELLTKESKNPIVTNFNNQKGIIIFFKSVIFCSLKNFNLSSQSPNISLYHGHGLWEIPILLMTYIAMRKGIPYLISPRGMLEPWALKTGRLKKKLAMFLYQKSSLKNAACLHATAKMEADNFRKLGFTNPIAIIPNGIYIPEFPLIRPKFERIEKRKILFLSRIHPKKGIEFLIKAWYRLSFDLRNDWKVEIAGNGEASYIATLQSMINTFGLSDEIQFTGPQFGENKFAAFHNADLFVLPTFSENFGIVVTEALACGVPVITTKGTPWEELNTYNAGWWIDIGVQPLVEALKDAMKLSDEERRAMGKNGRKLVEENYSIEAVAKQMIELYQWILGQGEKPKFIFD